MKSEIVVGSVVGVVNPSLLKFSHGVGGDFVPNMRVFKVEDGLAYVGRNYSWYSKDSIESSMSSLVSDQVQVDGSRLIVWSGMDDTLLDNGGLPIYPVVFENLKLKQH